MQSLQSLSVPLSPMQYIRRQKPHLLKSLDYEHIRVNVLPTLHKKIQHKYGMGRKLRKKKSERSTDLPVSLELSNLSFYTNAPTFIH